MIVKTIQQTWCCFNLVRSCIFQWKFTALKVHACTESVYNFQKYQTGICYIGSRFRMDL